MLRSLIIDISKQIPGKNFYSTTRSKVVDNQTESTSVLQKLSVEFEGVPDIASIVNRKHVKNIDVEEWKSRIYILKTFNFENSDCFQMISRYPFLLQIPPENLESTIRSWNACNIGTENFKSLLYDHPELLDVECNDIKKRAPYLQSLFKSSKSFVTLLANSPNLMIDDWNSTLQKIDYLLKVKCVQRRELIQSCALSNSLDLMMLRFEILEKCGVYTIPIVYAHKTKNSKAASQNPHLKDILDLSDELFAKKTAGITLEEYQVYENLFQTSENEESDEDDEDDEDDE